MQRMRFNRRTFYALLGYLRLLFNRQRYLSKEFFSITLNRIREAKVNYVLGFSACFVVVLIVSLMVTIIANSPVIFLRLAELQKGEIDIECSPQDSFTPNTRLNYTLAAAVLEEEPDSSKDQYSYHTARIQSKLLIQNNYNHIISRIGEQNNINPSSLCYISSPPFFQH